jgi:hypothetical protein
MMSTAGLTPSIIAQYEDPTHHALISQRFEMDLERWLDMTSSEVHEQSLWTLRVRRLFRGMAKLGIFCIDLKPANIVINTEPNNEFISDMKLIDFGGGLCWESLGSLLGYTVEWQVLYATLLLIFNASIKQTRPNLYRGTDGPFGDCIRSVLSSTERRVSVRRILTGALIEHYWSNLFFRVSMTQYMANFLQE